MSWILQLRPKWVTNLRKLWCLECARALTSFRCLLNSSITILGTGAKWLSVLEEKDVKPGKRASQGVRSLSRQPRKSDPLCYLVPASQAEGVGSGSNLSVILALVETHSLQTLRTILSTGSPLSAQSYDYVYRCVKSSVLLGSISGTAPAMCLCRGEGSGRARGLGDQAWPLGVLPLWPSESTGLNFAA